MMDAVAVIARLILAGVFALAAVGKLADLAGTRSTVVEFGAPVAAAPIIALAVPAAELATALLLVPAATAAAGATVALALLLAFSAVVAAAVARGRTPDCRCLGQIGGGPVTTGTLARNFALALLAGVVLVVSE